MSSGGIFFESYFKKMSDYDQETTTYSRAPDLEKLAETAPTRRELAWALLKQTRNAAYVAMRYGYDISIMEEALERLPPPETDPIPGRRAESLSPLLDRGKPKQAGELLEDLPSREPGSDDNLGE